MRRSHALLAFIAVAFLVLSTGWTFAGEGKGKPDPLLPIQQQIDELKAQIAALRNRTIQVYDSSEPPQYLGISSIPAGFEVNYTPRMIEVFVPELSLFAPIGQDGEFGYGELWYESSDCSGDAFMSANAIYTIAGIAGELYTGMNVAPTIHFFRSVRNSKYPTDCGGMNRSDSAVPPVKLSKEAIPFTTPVLFPLRYVLE